MENGILIGLAAMFGFVGIVVKVGLLVYFFVLFNRLIGAVERIEQRGMSIETALRNRPEPSAGSDANES